MTRAQRRALIRRMGFAVPLILGLALPFAPLVERADLGVIDLQFAALRSVFPRSAPEVVVVGIDEATVAELPEPIALWHAHLGAFLKAVTEGRARAVGLDVILPERSFNAVKPGLDGTLLEGLLAARGRVPVILGQTIEADGRPRHIFAPFLSLAGREAQGYVLIRPDADGVVRQFHPALGMTDGEEYTLVERMADRLGIDAKEGLINFAVGAPLDYIPLRSVLAWLETSDTQSLLRTFAGRPVLLGTVLPFEDQHRVPVPLAAWQPDSLNVPGVLVHAQALRSLLGPGLIQPVPWPAAAALTALATLLWFVGHTLWIALLAASAYAAAILGLATWLLYGGYWLPVTAIIVTAVLAAMGRLGWESAEQLAERWRLRRSFERYVSPQVMDEILEGRIEPGMAGRRRDVCVLFSDIRGFTERSEAMAPEEVIALLNRYFDEMAAAVHDHAGTVDKFIGDGLMAFFGAPKSLDNPSRAAFAAAQNMLQRLDALNRTLAAEGIPAIRIGVGLNSGEAVLGHVGSRVRFDYTAIGDVVNLASRLEGLTKATGYPVLCSARVVQALGGPDGFDSLGPLPVKGHSDVPVYGFPSRGVPKTAPQAT